MQRSPAGCRGGTRDKSEKSPSPPLPRRGEGGRVSPDASDAGTGRDTMFYRENTADLLPAAQAPMRLLAPHSNQWRAAPGPGALPLVGRDTYFMEAWKSSQLDFRRRRRAIDDKLAALKRELGRQNVRHSDVGRIGGHSQKKYSSTVAPVVSRQVATTKCSPGFNSTRCGALTICDSGQSPSS
jgi:hypothetical protein